MWEEIQQALAERRGFEFEYALRRRDGRIRHVHEYGQGVYGEDGEVVALEGLLYDVTEYGEAEEALREAEERLPHASSSGCRPTVYIQRPREG